MAKQKVEFLVTAYTGDGSVNAWCDTEAQARTLIALLDVEQVVRVTIHRATRDGRIMDLLVAASTAARY
jgi:glyceraldehyde-3-phosphate dehydrogenase/erythrose-4-phosphate dehydrogenase